MRVLLLVAVVGVVACKGDKAKETKAKPEPRAGKVDAATTAPVAAADGGVKEGKICEEPCRLLATEAYADVEARLAKECESELGSDDCGAYDYLRNCIYAVHGYRFRKARWQERFGAKGWYRPDPGFDVSRISRVGMKNVKELKERAAECRSSALETLEGEVVAELAVDLDGDGKGETMRITAEALEVAGAVLSHGLTVDDPRSLKAKVVDVDRSDRRNEVLLSAAEYEDLTDYVVVSMAGGKPRVSAAIYTGSLGLAGDGRLTTEDTNCGQTTRAVYKLTKGGLEKASEKTTGTHDNMLCAACPYVYLETESGWEFRGEILREVRFEAAQTTRSMRLGRASQRIVRVMIAERKPEITYLDAVAVVAGDTEIEPRRCQNDAGGALCAEDGAHHALAPRDELVLEFAVPPGAELTLRATGYYVPQ